MTALPKEPPVELIEAMALAYSTDWHSATEDQRLWWRLKSIDAYKALVRALKEPGR